MPLAFRLLCLSVAFWLAVPAHAQVPPEPNPNHEQMLASADPKVAANKRLVYDFWREVFEAGHMERAEKYLSDAYIQHNPNVPSGRAAFVETFSKRFPQPKPIQDRVSRPLVAILAEGDLVTLVFAREYDHPRESGKKYSTTWFDMFRVENGKITEHWDPALKQ